jgi:two-component system OmpR family sensor kinase
MRLPIRLRLTLIFSAGTALILLGLGAFIYLRLEADLLDSVDAGLRSRAQVLADAAATHSEQNVVTAGGKLIDPDEAFAQVLDASGGIVESSSAVTGAALLTASEIRAVSGPTFSSRQIAAVDDPVRLLAVSVAGATDRVAVVGATLGDVNEALQRLALAMATLGPIALLVMAGAGWLLAGAALRPVERMRREAAAVSASEPSRRLLVPDTGDELARLAATLNSMLDRLQEAIERERRFVDDASHELRTPLATLRAEIDLALARRRDAAELEASLRGAQEDVNRLERLAADLLVLARARGGRIPVHRVQTPLSDLVTRSVRSLDGRVAAAGVRIEIDVADASVDVDPDRIQQALVNLLENAIRHTPRDGVIHISARRTDGHAIFVVEDPGPGFPPELMASAFEPFTRGDGEATHPEGTGLGLSIVRAIAEAHGGSAAAENTPGGARVTLDVRI